ncbi:DNA-directed RNA polymerase III subunit Rpc5 [Lophiotrema nucula]|uniref:DNA-directed RNA polymerase III subunit Rpc5 n=1 Tax=Lophiotrema nucula TaxID=690887 RepID=A0A6A5ZQH4_9PLEO|nr:DNA-directed RNA polymerase III subunit Rpc5 [Lophiotrema nucula]
MPSADPSADAAGAANIEDDDPVVKEYDVYITPDLENQLLLLMQYANRLAEQPFSAENGAKPSQLRIKPKSGFVEVDVPVNVHQYYDRRKGVEWGEALRETKGFGQKAYGMAGGYERVMPRTGNRPGASGEANVHPRAFLEDDRVQDYVENFEDANEKGHVLNTQTWGGKIPTHDPNKPSYMVGAFRNNELHLSRLGGVVQLQVQPHHVDATEQLDVLRRKREKETQEGARPTEARAFVPTVKKSGGATSVEATQLYLSEAASEPWTKYQCYDENDRVSFEDYEKRLFHPDTANAKQLVSARTNLQVLDDMSTPSSAVGRKLAAKRPLTETLDISDDSDEDEAHEVNIVGLPSQSSRIRH